MPRLTVLGYLVVFLAIGIPVGATTWWLLTRIDRSYQVDQMEAERDQALDLAELRRLRAESADKSRVEAAQKLNDVLTGFNERLSEAKRYVATLPPKPANCGIGPDVTGMLNQARGYPRNEVPATP